MVLEGLHLPKPPDSWMALSPTEGSRCFCIKSRQPTGCRLSLVSVSESDSQKSVSEIYNEKNCERKKKIIVTFFGYVSEHCTSFGTTFLLVTFVGGPLLS